MTYKIDTELTDFDVKVYEALRQAINDFGMSPSNMELQHACLTSSATVYKAIRKLRRKGYIIAPKFHARAMRPTDSELELGNAPKNPWDNLVPPRKYFKAAGT